MGCSGGCLKVNEEEHNRLLKEQREKILKEQEEITNTLLQNEKLRLESEIEENIKAELLKYRKEFEENTANGAEMYANKQLKAYMEKEKLMQEEISKRVDRRIEEIRKAGAVVRPVIFEGEQDTKT